MSLITTGINIVASGVSTASAKIKQFGQSINNVQRQANQFATQYNRSTTRVTQSSNSLKRAMNSNWDAMYRSALSGTRNQQKALEKLENAYDRTFREIGNKYQSMVMGSVALSMSGVGIMNFGTATLGATKTALDQARDFETVMSQIAFYGQKTKDEMQQLQKDIFKMGFELPVKTSEIGNAVLGAQKLGYSDTDDAMKMAKEASKIQFMSLGKLDGEESLKYISHVRKLTGTAINDTAKLTDKLTMASDVSAASIDSLWKTLQSSRSAFDNLNTDIDTMLTLTGVMSDRLQPRIAGMSLSSFSGGVQMAEKAGMENRGTRGEYYNQLTGAMGGKLDDYGGDMIKYIQDVADKSKDLWGNGAERTGKLISIFGKSAIDLFHAIDAYNEGTGRSMVEMRQEIAKSDGHAQRLMDTLMNGSYGTEMRLQAMVEQFQILFGQTLRPAFNAILDSLTLVIGKVNEFMNNHPKWAKALGYGAGLAGILAVATGATFMFVGGILAIYASLANVMVQLARNTRVIHLLGRGYNTAGQMIMGNFLGPLKLAGKHLLKFSGITFFMYMAWKNDFLRMRTTLTDWFNYTKKGLSKANELFKLYGASSVQEWNVAFKKNQKNGTLDNWITDTALKLMILGSAIKDIWSDGTISADSYHKLNDMGLLGFVEQVYEIKTAVTDFWKGFQEGAGEGLRLLKDITAPLVKAWNWVSDKILEVLQHFGYFENVNKGITHKWEAMGAKLGVMVGVVVAIKVGLWAWAKAIKLVITPFAKTFKLTKGIWNLLGRMKNFKMGNIFKAMAWVLPKPLRNMARGGIDALQNRQTRRQQARMTGAHSQIPNARQTPTGQTTYTQPQTWRERRQLNRQRRTQGTIMPGRNGANATRRSGGFTGRMRDMWLGQQYVPEQRTDRRGRQYNQIRTRQGGVMRSTADGRVNGRQVRTGGMRGGLGRVGRFFGQYLGNQGGYVRLGGGGDTNGGNRNSLGSQGRQARGGRGGRGGGFKIGNIFKGIGKGIGKVAGGLGKGLLKGLGTVVKKGLPLLFKGALRLIPFVGWALMAWEGIRLIWSNWSFIEKAGQWAWEKIKQFGLWAWEGIKTMASTTWSWIGGVANTVWTAISNWAIGIWNGIGAWANGVWTGIKNWAIGVWNAISSTASAIWLAITGFATNMWNTVTTTAQNVWNGISTFANGIWDSISTYATGIWEGLKSGANSIFDGILGAFQTAWNNVKKWVAENPITQTIKKVADKVTGKGARTGEWYVPRDNMPYNLHQGEMVLTRKEAQIMRNMVGSNNNSIAEMLLDRGKEDTSGRISIKGNAKPRQLSIKPNVKQQNVKQETSSKGKGDTKIEFKEGAIQISMANATPAEIKKGAKQMFEEFKRLVELENMKNYRPARPKRV